MTSRHRRHTDRFKPPRRQPPPPVDDGLSFANLEYNAHHKVSLRTTQDDAAASAVEPMSVTDFLRQPSSPPEWSSTTSASLTDSEDFGSEADEEKHKAVVGRSGLFGQGEGQVKPTRLCRMSRHGSYITQEARLDEFMKSSSRLHEQMYRRIEALEGVVETLLEGYREVLGRVAELERRMGGRGEQLNEQLASLQKAVGLGRMRPIERVYEDGRAIDKVTREDDAQEVKKRVRGRSHRSRDQRL